MDELAGNSKTMNHQTSAVTLSNATLSDLPKDIERPTYNRGKLTPGIVHIGVGNFHRAHQAWYLHRLMQQGLAKDWAIIGSGVRTYDTAMRARLKSQDFLTTLIELAPEGTRAEISGSMIDYVPVQEANGALIEALSDPQIRIVSLTVTEGGYFVDPATNTFDAYHPDIQHDASHPSSPHTAFGTIIAALRIRRDNNTGPFTVLSCDNLQQNGDIARQAVISLASLSDPDLSAWIDTHVTFPNSMVDSIVPATGPEELSLVRALGIKDEAPVTHENFRQWVIEDDFCAGRPDFDKVGATFTNDVHGYEAMKLRILNAGHQLLANAGELLNVSTIDGCMTHPLIGAFFEKVQRNEIISHVDGVPGVTPKDYLRLVITRFSNPAVKDTTRRVAFDGSSRHTGFLLPILRDALMDERSANNGYEGLALAEALWARMCVGTREDGTQIEPNDPQWDELNTVAIKAVDEPMCWLEQAHIYGDISRHTGFVEAFCNALSDINKNGVTKTLTTYIQA